MKRRQVVEHKFLQQDLVRINCGVRLKIYLKIWSILNNSIILSMILQLSNPSLPINRNNRGKTTSDSIDRWSRFEDSFDRDL